jgi:hypothetical protein
MITRRRPVREVSGSVALFARDFDSRFFESDGCTAYADDELQESVLSDSCGRGETLPTGHVPMAKNHRPEDGVMVHA